VDEQRVVRSGRREAQVKSILDNSTKSPSICAFTHESEVRKVNNEKNTIEEEVSQAEDQVQNIDRPELAAEELDKVSGGGKPFPVNIN